MIEKLQHLISHLRVTQEGYFDNGRDDDAAVIGEALDEARKLLEMMERAKSDLLKIEDKF